MIGPMFDFSGFGIWVSDWSFRSTDFGFKVWFLDLEFHYLDLTFAKIDVG